MEKRATFMPLVMPALIVLLFFTVAAGSACGADYVKTLDVAPYIENNRTFDTTRSIAETFGIFVGWDQADQRVTLTRGGTQVIMRVGSFQMGVKTPEGEKTLSLDIAPQWKEGRVFLPVRLWAEHFGLTVVWSQEDGGVVVSEGNKALKIMSGKKDIELTGGHFLKHYNQDESLSFFYPEAGVIGSTWEGYAEVLLRINEDEYVITAMNAGAGRSDPIRYTEEEISSLIIKNAEENNTVVQKVPESYYNVPSYRVSGTISGIPQVGVVFLKDGFLCGMTLEHKQKAQMDISAGQSRAAGALRSEAIEFDESELSRQPEKAPVEIEEGKLQAYLAVLNGLLSEMMASFMVW